MRNLKRLFRRQTSLQPDTICFVVDDQDQLVYHASSTCQLACTAIDDGTVLWHTDLCHEIEGTTGAAVVSLTLAYELDAVCVVLSTGHILTVAIQGREGTRAAYDVGCVADCILAAAWSPGGDVLALVTAAHRLVALSLAWDVVADVALPNAHVAVSANLTWRGDGRFLAAAWQSCTAEGPTKHSIAIVETEAFTVTAQATDIDCATGVLSWQPNGRNLYIAQAVGGATGATQPDWAHTMDERVGQNASGISPASYPESGSAQPVVRSPHTHTNTHTPPSAVQGDPTATSYDAARPAVGIFETNGLPHGGFWVGWTVDGEIAEATRVVDMAWSPDSQLLAVVVAPTACAFSLVQLWRRSNWHWYCMQEWQEQGVARVGWGGGQGCVLQCLVNGLLVQTELGFDSDTSTLGTTCLVDGRALNITPLHECVIPPPMAAARLVFPSSVCLAAWAPSQTGPPGAEAVAVTLAGGGVCAVRCTSSWDTLVEGIEGASPAPDAIACWQAPVTHQCFSVPPTATLHALCCPDHASVLLAVHVSQSIHLHSYQLTHGWWLLDLQLDSAAPIAQTATVSDALRLPGCPRQLVAAASQTQEGNNNMIAWLAMQDGGLLAYARNISSAGALQGALQGGLSLPHSCDVVRAAADTVVALAGTNLVVGQHGQHGQHIVARDCTSMLVVEGRHDITPLLLWTTRTHRLHVLPFSAARFATSAPLDAADDAHGAGRAPGHEQQQTMGVGDEGKAVMREAMKPREGCGGILERSVEQGSMLLAAPEGNLETIQPRALVLPAVAAALAVKDYGRAWRMVVVNRVDVNLLVDYQWPSVLQHMGSLVDALASPAALCELLQGLEPSNVLHPATGMYKQLTLLLAPALQDSDAADTSQQLDALNSPDGVQDKIPLLCSAVRAALTARPDAAEWFSAVLTSHVVQADVGQALRCVAIRRREELSQHPPHDSNSTPAAAVPSWSADAHPNGNSPHSHAVNNRGINTSAAEAGISHLLTFVDAETLYRAALGVYELEVAYLVVTSSSKDPGEYLLQLQSFRDAGPDPHRIAHAVDIHLERWQSAMDHLMAVDDLDAALALATAHGLLRALLTALPTISPRRNDVLNAYAASLEAKHRHEDAALAYLAAGESQHAQRAYRAAGCWQQVLACAAANAASEGPPDVARLASDIAAELSTMHRPLEAAQVLLDYCDDAEGGVLLLCEGQAWREAVRQAHRAGRGDLVETVIVPAAAGRAAAVLGAAGDALARVDKYLERWRGVRDKRRALQAWQEAHADGAEVVMDDDAVSLVSTMVSGLSAYSAATHATTMSSSVAPSTVGGRPAQKRKNKAKQKKIKQGSGAEEAQLHALLVDMGPSAALLKECSELLELLVGNGHEEDARVLQGRVAAWVERFEAVKPEVEASPPAHELPTSKVKGVAWKWDLLR